MTKSRTTNRTKAKALHRVLDFTTGQDTIVLDFTMRQDTILYKARNSVDISSSPAHLSFQKRIMLPSTWNGSSVQMTLKFRTPLPILGYECARNIIIHHSVSIYLDFGECHPFLAQSFSNECFLTFLKIAIFLICWVELAVINCTSVDGFLLVVFCFVWVGLLLLGSQIKSLLPCHPDTYNKGRMCETGRRLRLLPPLPTCVPVAVTWWWGILMIESLIF